MSGDVPRVAVRVCGCVGMLVIHIEGVSFEGGSRSSIVLVLSSIKA
jgi:hypothetical protein